MMFSEDSVSVIKEKLDRARAIMAQPERGYDEKSLTDLADSVFRERIRLIGGLKKSPAASEEELELSKRAAARYALDASERLSGRFPDLSVAEEIVRLSAPCGTGTFRELDAERHIELAAAICVLDKLKHSGKLDDALPYLPESRDDLDRAGMPDIADSVHPDDLIRGMLYVVRYRNSDGPENAPGINKRNYDSIIALLCEDELDSARKQICDAVDSLAERLLSELSERRAGLTALAKAEAEACEGYLTLRGAVTPAPADPAAVAERLNKTVEAERNALRAGEAVDSALYRLEEFYLSSQDTGADIGVGDPYAACLGFISLLDSGSDRVMIRSLPYRVMSRVCGELPWAAASRNSGDRDEMNISPEFIEAAKSDPDKYIQSDSVLTRRIVKQPFADGRGEKINFAQLVYLTSGLVPPRGLPELSYLKALFDDSGLSEGEIGALYDYLTFAYYISKRDDDYIFIDEDDEEPQEGETADSEGDAELLREYKRELKGLKALINKLEHRLRKSEEALETAEEALASANSELAELRSMIRKADKTGEDYTATVDFPYTVRKRTVVFGGHDSWSKAIRPLLNEVRFVEPSAQPNPSMIMNADVVWIQTNAMSHANFYKIIDIVRKHDIEVRYFKYASAEKCAEQVALTDMELSEG